MSKENQQQNHNEEVDIIQLFEYFKNGIISIFEFFKNIWNWIVKLIILLLLCTKKNILLISLCAFFGALTIWGYFSYFPQKFYYSAVINMAYNSQYALSNNIKSINKNIEEKNNDLPPILASVHSLELNPIISLEDKVSYYNSMTNSIGSQNESVVRRRDSIFINTYPLDKMEEYLDDREYTTQQILITSSSPLEDPKKLEQYLLQDIQNDSILKAEKDLNLKFLEEELEGSRNRLKLIDSILLSYSKKENIGQTSSALLLAGSNSKNTVEKDLLEEASNLQNRILRLKDQILDSQYIVKVLAPLKQVEKERKIPFSPITGALLGILLAFVLILLKELNRFLTQYEKK